MSGPGYKRIVPAVALIAAVICCWLLASWYQDAGKISPDSVYYLRVAKNISEGKIHVEHRAGIDNYLTVPFYPVAIKFASFFMSDWKAAGVWVSKVSVILLMLVLFFWGRRAFGAQSGIVAAWLLAFCQYGYSTQLAIAGSVLTEGLFTLLYASSAWVIWEAGRGGRMLHCVLAGILVGLATLTRELGFILIPLGVLWIFVIRWFSKENSGARGGIFRGAIFGATACLVISPYWIYSLLLRGSWWGSRFAERDVRATAESVSLFQTVLMSVPNAAEALWRSFILPVSIAAAAGLVIHLTAKALRAGEVVKGKDSPLVFMIVYILWTAIALGILGVHSMGHFQRYILPAAPLVLLMAGRGVQGTAALAGAMAQRKSASLGATAQKAVFVLILGFLVFFSARASILYGKDLHNPEFKREWLDRGTEEMAEELKNEYRLHPDTYAYDRKPYLAYYLDLPWAGLPEDVTLAGLAEEARDRPVLLVVNSATIYKFGYERLRWLLAPSYLPEGWHLLAMFFFPEYGYPGRLVNIYSYGDVYKPFSVQSEDFSYGEHLRRAREYYDKGRFLRAEEHCDAALSINAEDTECRVIKAKILATKGGMAYDASVMKEAVDLLKKALSIDPRNKAVKELMCSVTKAKAGLDASRPICPE